ncbi:hypothetical protein PtB15_18B307 [Puccinia triticina]|nr:hypothetical protein PtB15_18B307 [Puccinia triticina]
MPDSHSDRLPPLSGWKSSPVCVIIRARTDSVGSGILKWAGSRQLLGSLHRNPSYRRGAREDDIAVPGQFRIDSFDLGSVCRSVSQSGLAQAHGIMSRAASRCLHQSPRYRPPDMPARATSNRNAFSTDLGLAGLFLNKAECTGRAAKMRCLYGGALPAARVAL